MEIFYLFSAIVLEVAGTTAMKLSEGFAKPLWIIPLVVCYLGALGLLTLSLQKIDLGTAYAIWSGLGTALIAILGVLVFKDPMTALKGISLGFIILGVVGLNLSGTSH